MKRPADSKNTKRYGLIAGWGNYPVLIARALKKAGHQVFCLGVTGLADSKSLKDLCDVYREMGLARFGAACRFFRKSGVTEATMGGKVFKKELLRPGVIWRHLPDPYTFCSFFSLFFSRRKDMKDDTLLQAAARAFERRGIHFLPATDLVPNLLIASGTLTCRRFSETDQLDICQGWQLAREIGRLDFGQDVTIRNGTILSVEGIDGTDETILRGRADGSGKPFMVIKVAKPNQDMRFDVPAVGVGTLRRMAEAGADRLVLEAERTLCVDPLEEFIAEADALGIAVAAVQELELSLKPVTSLSSVLPKFRPLTKGALSEKEIKDIQFGLPVLFSMERFSVGAAVTIRERSVLAVASMTEPLSAILERSRRFAPDGFTLFFGSPFGKPDALLTAESLTSIKQSGVRLLVLRAGFLETDRDLLIQAAEKARLTIVEIDTLVRES